jgi:hypothetical protein
MANERLRSDEHSTTVVLPVGASTVTICLRLEKEDSVAVADDTRDGLVDYLQKTKTPMVFARLKGQVFRAKAFCITIVESKPLLMACILLGEETEVVHYDWNDEYKRFAPTFHGNPKTDYLVFPPPAMRAMIVDTELIGGDRAASNWQ